MKKSNIKKQVVKSLELPGEYALSLCKISISDFSQVEIVNYRSIIEYGDNMVRINTKEKIIKVDGLGLNIENITDDEIKISGQIKGVSFE